MFKITREMLTPEFVERFNSRIKKLDNGCWEWTGYKQKTGYGRISLLDRNVSTHRIAVILAGVDLPVTAHVCHSCDYPPCVNPEHLRVADNKYNVHDAIAKGRHLLPTTGQCLIGCLKAAAKRRAQTHCKRGHEFTLDNTYRFRDGRRTCRTCRNGGQRAIYARNRAVKLATSSAS